MTNNKFDLGQVLATPGALSLLEESGESATTFLRRHAACDWGELCEEDRQLNDDSIEDGSRILSSYRVKSDDDSKLWIITEAQDDDGRRAATTILLASEY